MIKYMNGSVFSKARYMNGVGFEILARTPVPKLPLSYPPPPPPPLFPSIISCLAVEAGLYGDTGRVIGFFYEVKQRRSRLVPGWVTAVLDFVEDPVSRYIGGNGGMEDSVLSVLHSSALGFAW